MKNLKTQPGCVKNFKISTEFHTDGISFNKAVDWGHTKNEGLHSMLVIGGHYSQVSGKYFFLLQNWWEKRFFIEVSAEYLVSVQAEIIFAIDSVTSIPKEFKCIDSPYVETAVDVGERLDERQMDNV
jgi:hypothetical protein